MQTPRVRCPTCQREVPFTPESKFRPFCSERCRMVDLGAWFAEERSMPGEAMPLDEGAPKPQD
ncbi:MAG: DNA gyrase inhibitor YacG [Steroidobacteraceae bacterium]